MRMYARYYCEACGDNTLHRWEVEVDEAGLVGRPQQCCQCRGLAYAKVGTIHLGSAPGSFAEDFIDFRTHTSGGSLAWSMIFLALAGAALILLYVIGQGVMTGRW